jgi:glycosyltransferase involved in cell wall biosynthesis
MTSIIIPAHNEESVILETLNVLMSIISVDDEVVVVTNGCSDNTEKIARKMEPRITVVNTKIPSKTNALNLGEQHVSSFPRIYMDADIRLTKGTIEKIYAALVPGKLLATAPEPRMDFTGSSWSVKAYYDIWLSLPYCRNGMMGSGVFALSKEARERFETFPDVISDDGYIRALFREHERGKAEGAVAIVRAPANLHWLLKIKVRSRLGQMEIAMKFPQLRKNEQKSYGSAIAENIRNPLKWPKLAIYLYVNVISRLQARRKIRDLPTYQWEKDMSSRK